MIPWERIVEPVVPLQLHAGLRFNGRVISTGGLSAGVPVPWVVATQNPYRYERIVEDETPQGFGNRCAHAACVFDNKMWIQGGIVDGTINNEVLMSMDGKAWEVIHNFQNLYAHRMVAFGDVKEALVVMGGFGVAGAEVDGIYRSTDGRHWETVDVFGTKWSPRGYFGLLVYKNKLWLFGGINAAGESFNDVWWTDDLRRWHRGLEHAPWSARSAFGYCIFDERMWIIGGKVYDGGRQGYIYHSDVWFSRDGTTWEQSFDFPTEVAHTHVEECNGKIHVFDGLLGGSAANTGVYRMNIG